MNKTSWTILAVLLLILAALVWIMVLPVQEQPKPAAPLNWAKNDPLFAAVHSGNYDMVKKLVKEKPHILNERHTMGGTYLNCAVSTKDMKMLNLMLKLGGDPNFGAGCGTTPLIMATRQGDMAMVSALLKANANPNVVGEGSCPLTMAIKANETEIVTLLKKHHAKEVIMGPNGIMPKPAKP
jgi:ankyrin repeat protein